MFRVKIILWIILVTFEAWSQNDAEPNDTVELASQIPINTAVNGSISQERSDNSVDDQDWFKFTLPADGRVIIHQSHSPTGLGFQYFLFGEENLDSSITGTETHLPPQTDREVWLQAGTYFFQLRGRGERTVRTYTLQIELQAAPSVDEDIEQNDNLEAASPITLNATHTGHISYVGTMNQPDDIDWYRINLPKDGQVRIRINQVAAGRGFQYNLFGQNELNSTILSTETHLPENSIRDVWLQQGIYYLRITGRSERIGRVYRLHLEHIPAPDVHDDIESNDTQTEASLIQFNETRIGHISHVREDNSPDNHDWYQIDLPSDGPVRIHQTHTPAGQGFQYFLFGFQNLSSSIIGTETHLPQTTAREVWLQQGQYFLHLTGRGERIGRVYELMLEHIPAPAADEGIELNDTVETASPITLNATHTGHLSHVREDNTPDNDDWYRIALPADGLVRIRQSHDIPGFGLQYFLYGSENLDSSIVGTETHLPSPTARNVWLQQGTYFFHITGRSARTGRVYKLRLEHIPALPVNIDREPNDAAESASPLILNATHTGHLSFVGNANMPDNSDWYTFNLPIDDTVTIHITQTPTGSGFQYTLFTEENLNYVHGSETHIPESISRAVDLTAGTYFMKINGRGERIGRTYQIHLETTVPTAVRKWRLY